MKGADFSPTKCPIHGDDENIHNVTGRGIVLMREYMDSVEYNELGNRVRMVKHFAQTKNKE